MNSCRDPGNAQYIEVKAVNYAQPGGIPQTNPAGIIYSIELGGFITTPAIIPVVPPNITNPPT